MPTYKPVGVDENSLFPPRIETRLTSKIDAQRAPRVFTTALRPVATDYTAGSQIYDSTLKRPLWSDGTVWRYADGTAA